MLKETITYEIEPYEDEQGNVVPGREVTDTLWFHLSKLEVFKLELGWEKFGGISGWLQNLIDSDDNLHTFEEFEKLVVAAFGVRIMDGRAFDKSPEVAGWFKYSKAKEEFIIRMMTDIEFGSNFVNRIWPKDLEATVEKMADAQPEMEAKLEELRAKDREKNVIDVEGQVGPKPPLPPGVGS